MQRIWFCLAFMGLLLSVRPSIATTTRSDLYERIAAETSETTEAPALEATPCVNGLAAGYPCNNVDLISFMPLGSIGGGGGNDIWGWTDPTTGNEYALMGRTSGTSFIDITDAENPIYLGNLPTQTVNSSWRDVKVYADHAFIVSEANGHGMQIFDLTQLRDVTNPPVTFSNTAHYSGFGSSHNIVINEESGTAYSVGDNTCSGGLHIVNISNPTSPDFESCFSADGYTHDAQCVIYNGPDTDYQGKELCFNSNEDTLTIVDVTNKRAPVQISRTSYSGSSYTHQGWLTEDHAYFLLGDELDEQVSGDDTTTYIWNLSDLENPINTGIYESGNPAIDHNMYILDGLAYQSNYTSGLRIIATANVANAQLEELAFFDVYPQHNNATFSGTWSNYPYFASGNVIVSSIDRGLFIVRPTLEPTFNLQVVPQTVTLCTPGSAIVDVSVGSVLNFTDAVDLSISGLPANTTATFSPTTVTPNMSSSLELTSATAATDSTTITLEGESGSTTKSVDLTLNRLETPSTPQLLTPTNGAVDQAPRPILSWEMGEGIAYLLEISSDSAFMQDVETHTMTTNSFQPYVSLEPSTTYYWRVRALNVCGESAFVDGSFTTAAEPTAVGTAEIGHSADFEDGRNGWVGGNWHIVNSESHTGASSLFAPGSLGITQKLVASGQHVLPSDKKAIRLNFWHQYDLQTATDGCMDGGTLEISVDNAAWQPLNGELYGDSYTGPIRSETSSLPLNTGAWCGDSDGWQAVSADLSAFAGSTVRLRFRLANDDGVRSSGWYIDDIELAYYDGKYTIFMPMTFTE